MGSRVATGRPGQGGRSEYPGNDLVSDSPFRSSSLSYFDPPVAPTDIPRTLIPIEVPEGLDPSEAFDPVPEVEVRSRSPSPEGEVGDWSDSSESDSEVEIVEETAVVVYRWAALFHID